MNLASDARVKLRSLLLTALIRVPSTASSSRPNRSSCRQSRTNSRNTEYRAESRAVVAPEIGDGLEVRLQVPQQPDHFEVATGLRFQPPARTHSVQIAVDVELQEIARGIARAAGRLRHDTGEPCRRKAEPINKGVDEPHRVLSADVVVDRLRQKQRLAAVVSGDVRHAWILSRERPRRNALRPSFHTVCLIYAPKLRSAESQFWKAA